MAETIGMIILAALFIFLGIYIHSLEREIRRLEKENAEHRKHDVGLMTDHQIYAYLDRRQRMRGLAIPPTIHPSAEGGFHATDT